VGTNFDSRYPIYIEIDYTVLRPTVGLRAGFRLLSSDGTIMFTARDNDGVDLLAAQRSTGTFMSRCEIPGNLLKGGRYFVTVSGAIPGARVNFQVESAVSFWVETTDSSFEPNRAGVIAPQLRWVIQRTGPVDDLVGP
jgi:lipopolysaccharide transport system ATP-binding protein